MADLSFNTDQGRATTSAMQTALSQMQDALTSASTGAQSLQQAWTATGSDQYQADYAQWKSTMTNLLDSLQNLRSRLDNEIVEWEAAAKSF